MSRATIAMHLREAGHLLVEVGRHVDAAGVHLGDEGPDVIEVPADATLKEVQRKVILAMLEREAGHVTRTARRLGISRRTVQYVIAAERGRGAGPEGGSGQ